MNENFDPLIEAEQHFRPSWFGRRRTHFPNCRRDQSPDPSWRKDLIVFDRMTLFTVITRRRSLLGDPSSTVIISDAAWIAASLRSSR